MNEQTPEPERMSVTVVLEYAGNNWAAETPETEWFGQGRTPEEAITSLFRTASEEVMTDPVLLLRRRKGSALKFWGHMITGIALLMASNQAKITALYSGTAHGTINDMFLLMHEHQELQNAYDLYSLDLQREALQPDLTQNYIASVQEAGQ